MVSHVKVVNLITHPDLLGVDGIVAFYKCHTNLFLTDSHNSNQSLKIKCKHMSHFRI